MGEAVTDYILRPPAVEGGDGFIIKAPEKSGVRKVGDALLEIPRQLGLTARYGVEGLADVAQIGTEPIRYFVNPLLEASGLQKAPSLRSTVSGLMDKAGVPSPQNETERVVGDATRMVAGAGGLAGGARAAAGVVPKVAVPTMEALASNPGAQTVSAATAGGAGGAVREAGGGEGAQFTAALASGLTGAGLTVAGQKLYTAVADVIRRAITPKSSMAQINLTLNGILEQNGIDVSNVSQMVRSELAHEVKKALDTGKALNPDVIRRIADYGVVGATPTRGSVTLDPGIVTRERNLAKLGANSSDVDLQQLSGVQNANNSRLIANLNEMGATGANANPVVAGEKVIGAITARDAAARGVETSLYNKARDSSGRAIELDGQGFVYDAYRRLAESNRGAFLPEGIKSILEQLRTGKQKLPDGTVAPMPFTVDTIDNMKTMLATAQRGATDGNARAALSQVRAALDDVQPVAVGRPTGSTLPVDPAQLAAAQNQANTVSQQSLDAFDKARRFSRARHNWQESAPGIADALSDANPDRFVRDYIISNGAKSSTADVERMLHTVNRDPQAKAAVQESVMAYLKRAALGKGGTDEAGNFSASNFNGAMNEIGDLKLRLFFTPEQIAQLKAVGRVAQYETFQPRGSAVNNSNSAAALGGWFVDALEKIGQSSLVGRIPMGDSLIRTPAKNWSAQIGVNAAMDPYAAASRSAVPQSGRLADLLGPGLLLSAPRADGNDNQRRN